MNYKGRAPFQSAAFTETQRNFTYFDKSLTSGLTDAMIESPGDFLYIDQASTGVVRVELNMRQGGTLAPITLAAGGSIECDFSSIKLNADAQLNKTVRIIIGNGAKIKGGANVKPSSEIIQTVDGSRYRTENGQARVGVVYCPPTAGQYSHSQLFNPANSGVNAFVNQVSFSAAIAGAVETRFGTTELSTPAVKATWGSKKLGGAASAIKQLYQANVGYINGESFFSQYIAANQSSEWRPTEPLLIPPGYGLTFSFNVVGNGFLTNFEGWIE